MDDRLGYWSGVAFGAYYSCSSYEGDKSAFSPILALSGGALALSFGYRFCYQNKGQTILAKTINGTSHAAADALQMGAGFVAGALCIPVVSSIVLAARDWSAASLYREGGFLTKSLLGFGQESCGESCVTAAVGVALSTVAILASSGAAIFARILANTTNPVEKIIINGD